MDGSAPIIVHSASLKGHSDVIVQLEDKSLEVAVPEGGQGSFELSTASYVAQPLEGDLITGVTLCLDVDSVQVNA